MDYPFQTYNILSLNQLSSTRFFFMDLIVNEDNIAIAMGTLEIQTHQNIKLLKCSLNVGISKINPVQ